ncbi:hypothetical protein Sjap_000390 [Stephania japonica]|uniref:Uncharacterized protein n=1 Tax=Stephania japonica TaxID=461633 RepID=A0AAP0KKI7_9MAGN
MYARTWNSGKEKTRSLVSSLRCSEFLVIYIVGIMICNKMGGNMSSIPMFMRLFYVFV